MAGARTTNRFALLFRYWFDCMAKIAEQDHRGIFFSFISSEILGE
jgi:hypothetical protein